MIATQQEMDLGKDEQRKAIDDSDVADSPLNISKATVESFPHGNECSKDTIVGSPASATTTSTPSASPMSASTPKDKRISESIDSPTSRLVTPAYPIEIGNDDDFSTPLTGARKPIDYEEQAENNMRLTQQNDDEGEPEPGVSKALLLAAATLSPPSKAPPVEVKLFVGRVPRTYLDEHLRPLFEKYGTVGDVIIIRDRTMGAHKGCAFVRMKSITEADAAIRDLNNQKVLDSSLGPLLVKYAAGEPERLGVPVEMAQPGHDQAKLFVGSLPRTTTEEEIHAVFAMFGQVDEVFLMRDEQRVSKGCAFVKFAFKEQSFHAIANLNGKFTMPGSNRAVEVRFAESRKTATTERDISVGQAWQEFFTNDARPYYYNPVTQTTQWERPHEFDLGLPATNVQNSNVAPGAVGAQTHGPPGANVFIFHIPNGWTESDVISHFAPYGQIVSARIATDRGTGRNRGFGFVSYHDAHSSIAAVEALNGLAVSGKRLKVQIKKGEEQFAIPFRGQYQPAHLASQMSLGSVQNSVAGGMMSTGNKGPHATLSHINMLSQQLGGVLQGGHPQGPGMLTYGGGNGPMQQMGHLSHLAYGSMAAQHMGSGIGAGDNMVAGNGCRLQTGAGLYGGMFNSGGTVSDMYLLQNMSEH